MSIDPTYQLTQSPTFRIAEPRETVAGFGCYLKKHEAGELKKDESALPARARQDMVWLVCGGGFAGKPNKAINHTDAQTHIYFGGLHKRVFDSRATKLSIIFYKQFIRF